MISFFMLIDSETDREKFKKLYEAYQKKMLYVAYQILKNQQDAEDVVQDSFLAIARHISSIGSVGEARTGVYLMKTVKNRALNLIRDRKETVNWDEVVLPIQDNIQETMCIQEEVKQVLEAIYQLKENYRDVLCLYFLNQLTTKEIADVLGRNHNTVKSELRRGKKQLLQLINQ